MTQSGVSDVPSSSLRSRIESSRLAHRCCIHPRSWKKEALPSGGGFAMQETGCEEVVEG